MKPGEVKAFTVDTVPSPAKINVYEDTSSDESVVTVDDCGVLTAVGPGQTAVHLKAMTNGESRDEYIINETDVTVIVAEETVPVEITYTADDQTWQKGSASTLTVTVHRSIEDETCFSHFQDVRKKQGSDRV